MPSRKGPKPRSEQEHREILEALPRTAAGCWEWQRALQNGYGYTTFRGERIYAHRLAYMLFRGSPGKLCVLHHCDYRPCCNPEHLFLGTRADNIADMWTKGRQSTSAQRATYGNARLTEDDVREIRRMYAVGTASQQAIGEAFGLSQTAVSGIIRHVRWPHVV